MTEQDEAVRLLRKALDEWVHKVAPPPAPDVADLRDALEGMVQQFAYWSGGHYWTGGLSALEQAFKALGWDGPTHPAPEWAVCDEPGCTEQRTCGIPTPAGYRSVCGPHYQALNREREARHWQQEDA